MAGDYNQDGTVNASDYVVWRNALGTAANLTADGNGNGTIDAGDYTVWRSHFGMTQGSGQILLIAAIPEPAGLAYLALGVGLLLPKRPKR